MVSALDHGRPLVSMRKKVERSKIYSAGKLDDLLRSETFEERIEYTASKL